MKLKNKKTGEIVDDGYIRETNDFYRNGKRTIAVFVRGENRPPERVSIGYETLAELNAEWEDVPEEPKRTWFIDTYGSVCDREAMTLVVGWDNKPIFEFETKEEAEEAVEKLKAFKRLKDKGFKFVGWDKALRRQEPCDFVVFCNFDGLVELEKDLDLLFGGDNEQD